MALGIQSVSVVEAGLSTYVAIEVENDLGFEVGFWLRRTPALPAGAEGYVNGKALYLIPDGATRTIYDTTAPWGEPFEYEWIPVAPFTTWTKFAQVVTIDPFTFAPPLIDSLGQQQYAALRHLELPSKSVGLTVESMSLQAVNADVGVFYGVNSRRPSVVDGPNRGNAGTVTVITNTDAERRALADLLDSTAIFLLWTASEAGPDDSNMFVTVPQHTRARVGRYMREQARVWDLEVLEVDSPVGDVADLPTWQSVLDEYATWQEVLDENAAVGATWGDFVISVPPLGS